MLGWMLIKFLKVIYYCFCDENLNHFKEQRRPFLVDKTRIRIRIHNGTDPAPLYNDDPMRSATLVYTITTSPNFWTLLLILT